MKRCQTTWFGPQSGFHYCHSYYSKWLYLNSFRLMLFFFIVQQQHLMPVASFLIRDQTATTSHYKINSVLSYQCHCQQQLHHLFDTRHRRRYGCSALYQEAKDNNNSIKTNRTNTSNDAKQQRSKQVAQLKEKLRKEKQASASMDLPKQPLVTTIGAADMFSSTAPANDGDFRSISMIFDMTRRMSLLQQQQQPQTSQEPDQVNAQTTKEYNNSDDKNIQTLAQKQKTNTTTETTLVPPTLFNTAIRTGTSTSLSTAAVIDTLPRWHPTNGIVSTNPLFRTKSPIMTNEGYATLIWKNVRKKNSKSMWRYSLRTFDRMLEQQKINKNLIPTVLRVRPTTVHYEGALVACSKLGLATRAIEIYRMVENDYLKAISSSKKGTEQGLTSGSSRALNSAEPAMAKVYTNSNHATRKGSNKYTTKMSNIKTTNKDYAKPNGISSSGSSMSSTSSPSIVEKYASDTFVQVTDNMIMSVIRSCVKASKQKYKPASLQKEQGGDVSDIDSKTNPNTANSNSKILKSVEDRAKPLDDAVEIVMEMEYKYKIPLCAVHINPLSRAYQDLGLYNVSNTLIQQYLFDRITGPEAEDINNNIMYNNINADSSSSSSSSPTKLRQPRNTNTKNGKKQRKLSSVSTGTPFNVFDVQAKDKGSYSLLVRTAVLESDWGNAIDSLREMTEAGLYPSSRHLNSWIGISKNKPRKRNNETTTNT